MFDKNQEHTTKSDSEISSTTAASFSAALDVSTPAWPLQNTVAVNPFWFRRNESFENVLSDLCSVMHDGLYMSLEYYLERFSQGEISNISLTKSLERLKTRYPSLPTSSEEFLRQSHATSGSSKKIFAVSEFLDRQHGLNIADSIKNQISHYAAAYFDDRQALAPFPWKHLNFLGAWTAAVQNDQNPKLIGLENFNSLVRSFEGKTAGSIIKTIFDRLEIFDNLVQRKILERLTFTTLGWMSQFRYVEWQKNLGYEVHLQANPLDFLAVRFIYDFAALESFKTRYPETIEQWLHQVNGIAGASDATKNSLAIYHVWQTSLESSYQKRITDNLSIPTGFSPDSATNITTQIAFCIDVRSEMIRRHIESTSPDVATIGFAGFFGVAVDYKKIDEKEAGHRCPVLLTPALRVNETSTRPGRDVLRKFTRKMTLSYFKGLRKAPMSSFVYVEMLGILSLSKMIARYVDSTRTYAVGKNCPERFSSRKYCPDTRAAKLSDGTELDQDARTTRAVGILKHLGLTTNFARLVVIAGHGSHTTNNAFGSALDCGACGGHAGDINARVLTDLLNDSEVRSGCAGQGIRIPGSTRFVSAVHDTVTDEVHLLGKETLPPSHKLDITKLERVLKTAASTTRFERQSSRSRFLAQNTEQRAQNWSEIRPEWALAGNACFIVAPRDRTKGVNLTSRSFLHDYDYVRDSGFATLELIMTAPMVVTNWINMQYYASTVAPKTYGAGNKVLHNVVNESGVLEGNGGDLRVGLPYQSVHDGLRFVHDPLRLSVYIEAPQNALEAIIAKHQVVRELVDNEWLYLLQIDRDTSKVYVRRPAGVYEEVT